MLLRFAVTEHGTAIRGAALCFLLLFLEKEEVHPTRCMPEDAPSGLGWFLAKLSKEVWTRGLTPRTKDVGKVYGQGKVT
jgi:hypothetical protein